MTVDLKAFQIDCSCVLQSVRTQETVPLLKAAKRVVLLTGTPALSRPKELFSQLTALAPSAKLKMKDFGERYCQCDRYRPYAGQYDGKLWPPTCSVQPL